MSRLIPWQGGLIDPHDPDDLEQVGEWLNAEYHLHVEPFVTQAYGPPSEDPIAHNTAFNDWTDGLCKDGTIGEHAYNNVCRED